MHAVGQVIHFDIPPKLEPRRLMFALNAYEVNAYRGLQEGLLGVAGLIVVAAVLEELIYRCILFRILETAMGTVWALWLQSLVFALMHIANI